MFVHLAGTKVLPAHVLVVVLRVPLARHPDHAQLGAAGLENGTATMAVLFISGFWNGKRQGIRGGIH
jgi:hypothetical protein